MKTYVETCGPADGDYGRLDVEFLGADDAHSICKVYDDADGDTWIDYVGWCAIGSLGVVGPCDTLDDVIAETRQYLSDLTGLPTRRVDTREDAYRGAGPMGE